MYANNETGVIFPVGEIGEIASRKGIPFLCDSVQAAGKVPVNFKELPVDFLTVSGHKFHAPKGTGALIVRKGIDLGPLIHGGSQERHRRGGTENVPGIVGFGAACEIARRKLESESARIRALRVRFEQRIMELIPNVKLNGHPEKRLPNTSNISFIGANAELLLTELDRAGVSVSAGSACTSGNRTISHVLGAMGLDDATARSAIRFSLGRENTEADLDYVLELLPGMIEKLRRKKATKPCITVTTDANSVFD
jgi:cysteine desulfurase